MTSIHRRWSIDTICHLRPPSPMSSSRLKTRVNFIQIEAASVSVVLRCSFRCNAYAVNIDSITRSFCLRHYVQNSLSYPAEETWPMLCLKGCQAKLGIISLGTINDQLLCRIQSIWTFTNLQYIEHKAYKLDVISIWV